ncbi:BON domain-containing protein [Caballeronia sp. ATUFL_M2_KS44]|uniref:BON domain-containing protein n=1 Tax=Caballeronia sp. ATUFL_M2_KS44 TaxID=2921767 RepID=UPI0020290DA9|nr:BON domain-containing protein [Caballeronia sp. ATUFL_M2_KS44]
MKNMQTFTLAMGAIIAAASLTAWSQTSEPASASAMAASSSISGSATPATGRQANRALRRRVYGAIAKNKDIDAGNISVVAKDGAVKLTGTVADASQVNRVGDIVRGVPGVVSVSNGLTVKKPFGGM